MPKKEHVEWKRKFSELIVKLLEQHKLYNHFLSSFNKQTYTQTSDSFRAEFKLLRYKIKCDIIYEKIINLAKENKLDLDKLMNQTIKVDVNGDLTYDNNSLREQTSSRPAP